MTQTQTRTLPRRLTAADLAALPTDLPSGSVRYELWGGALHVLPPHTYMHSAVVTAIATSLQVQGAWREQGRACCGDVGIILGSDPDTVVGADVIFLTKDQLPPRCSPEDYLETMPALIAEVEAPNDPSVELARRVTSYLAAGARLVWVANAEQRALSIHRPGRPPVVLGVGDTLTAEGIIPGFAVPVAELFEDLD